MPGMPKRRLRKTLREINGGVPVTSREESLVDIKTFNIKRYEFWPSGDVEAYKDVVKKCLEEVRAETAPGGPPLNFHTPPLRKRND